LKSTLFDYWVIKKTVLRQSETSSNWFYRNDYGRLGVGSLVLSELEPMIENLETKKEAKLDSL